MLVARVTTRLPHASSSLKGSVMEGREIVAADLFIFHLQSFVPLLTKKIKHTALVV